MVNFDVYLHNHELQCWFKLIPVADWMVLATKFGEKSTRNSKSRNGKQRSLFPRIDPLLRNNNSKTKAYGLVVGTASNFFVCLIPLPLIDMIIVETSTLTGTIERKITTLQPWHHTTGGT